MGANQDIGGELLTVVHAMPVDQMERLWGASLVIEPDWGPEQKIKLGNIRLSETGAEPATWRACAFDVSQVYVDQNLANFRQAVGPDWIHQIVKRGQWDEDDDARIEALPLFADRGLRVIGRTTDLMDVQLVCNADRAAEAIKWANTVATYWNRKHTDPELPPASQRFLTGCRPRGSTGDATVALAQFQATRQGVEAMQLDGGAYGPPGAGIHYGDQAAVLAELGLEVIGHMPELRAKGSLFTGDGIQTPILVGVGSLGQFLTILDKLSGNALGSLGELHHLVPVLLSGDGREPVTHRLWVLEHSQQWWQKHWLKITGQFTQLQPPEALTLGGLTNDGAAEMYDAHPQLQGKGLKFAGNVNQAGQMNVICPIQSIGRVRQLLVKGNSQGRRLTDEPLSPLTMEGRAVSKAAPVDEPPTHAWERFTMSRAQLATITQPVPDVHPAASFVAGDTKKALGMLQLRLWKPADELRPQRRD